jgi:hypothetical protein
MIKKSLLVISILFFATLAGFYLVGKLRGRITNEYEMAYRNIAVEMGSPELCYKIYRGANIHLAGLGGYSYKRSECFSNLAVKTKNPDLCDEVGKGGRWDRVTKDHCLRGVERGRLSDPSGHISWHQETTKEIFKKMGYSDKKIKDLYEDLNAQGKAVHNLLKTDDFRNRIDRLPDFDR